MRLFLAGAESYEYFMALRALEYPYRLMSYFSFRSNKPGKKGEEILRLAVEDDKTEWLLDSGVFSLVFGTGQDDEPLKTEEDFYRYASEYVEWCHQIGWKKSIFEVDVQGVVGIDATQRIREKVFEKCGIPTIYVWHKVDGLAGAQLLAQQYDHVSIGGIARVARSTMLSQVVLRLLHEFRTHGNPKTHLLGVSSPKLMSFPVDSCDSTSWLSGVRYGSTFIFRNGKVEKADLTSPLFASWLSFCRDRYSEAFKQESRKYQVEAMASAIAFWMAMENINGEA